jgi:hypothetical protein
MSAAPRAISEPAIAHGGECFDFGDAIEMVRGGYSNQGALALSRRSCSKPWTEMPIGGDVDEASTLSIQGR